MSGIRFFCLPYAGGSAAVYMKWNKMLDESIKLYPFELAGRAGRYKEPYYTNIKEAVDDITGRIEEECRDSEYALWGHCLGSILVYEAICLLQEKKFRLPRHAFFSGIYPPGIKKEKIILHTLAYGEFENLSKMKEPLRLAMQTLRADYRLLESYEPSVPKRRFDFNISVLAGRDDKMAATADLKKWKNYCARQCSFYYFEGGHFYLHTNAEEITRIINNTLVTGYQEGEYGG